MPGWKIGVIGGSGLYAIDALEDPQWLTIDTPWGVPSDQLLTGRIGAVEFVFLPRHVRSCRGWSPMPPAQPEPKCSGAAPILRGKVRSFRLAPKACSTASGAATFSG